MNPPFCLEKGKNYTVRLDFIREGGDQGSPTASIVIDSASYFNSYVTYVFLKSNELIDNLCPDCLGTSYREYSVHARFKGLRVQSQSMPRRYILSSEVEPVGSL